MKDPTASAQKWATNLAAAGPAIQAGVDAVTVAPGAAAVRQKAAWVQNTPAAADKWARNTSAVSREDWQKAMTDKAVPRIAQGAQSAQPKMQAFLTNFLPFLEGKVNALPPRGNLEQNIARATKLMRDVSTYRKP